MSEVVLEVNGKPISLCVGVTVADLVESMKLSPTGVAIAVNQVVIPTSERQRTCLKKDDRVEIIHAVGGG